MSISVKIPATVEKVNKHTDEVCSYIFRPKRKCPRFKPGHFLHLAIDPYDPSFQWPESRVFSIANSPTRREKMKITFAVKGKFTKRMYDEIKEGDTIWIKLPYGYFTFNENEKDIVLIAGGTGITPFLSFLEYSIDNKINSKIKLYYGIRSKELLLFEDIISECETKLSNFRKIIYLEKKNIINNKFRNEKLNIEQILDETDNKENTIFYLSGPVEMVNNFKAYLSNNGITETQIRIDKWE